MTIIKNIISWFLLIPVVVLILVWFICGMVGLVLWKFHNVLEKFIDLIVKFNDTKLMNKLAGKN